MPQHPQSTQTAPTYASEILHGGGHVIRDRTMDESQDLPAGQVMGMLYQTGRHVPVDMTEYAVPLSGDGSQTTFDLDHDSVDPGSIRVLEGGSAVYDFDISRGTGTNGEDQIVFGTAPASGTDNVTVRYYRTSATPAGVLLRDVVTEAGEFVGLPLVIEGAVVMDKLTGVPAGYTYGMRMGALTLE